MAGPLLAPVLKTVLTSKRARKWIFGALAVVVGVPIGGMIAVAVLVATVFTAGSSTSMGLAGVSCVPQLGQVSKVQVDGYNSTQLSNAAAIMQAASQLGLPKAAQVLGVQAAIQESGLRVLDYGDTVGPDSRGLFQQRDSWGPLSVRMDPLGSATLFFQALAKIPGWTGMPAEEAIHEVQVNERASDYAPRRADAEKIVDAWSAVSCVVSMPVDAVSAAKELVAGQAAGTVHPMMMDHWSAEILPYTTPAGPSAGCQVDVRVMQIAVLALHWYGEVGFSDLGRSCVNDCSAGIGTASLHCMSPDLAIDFTSLGGQPLSGNDSRSVDFVRRLATVLPPGAGIGQSDCRAENGTSVDTPGIRQFPDGCTHLHVEVGVGTGPLNAPTG